MDDPPMDQNGRLPRLPDDSWAVSLGIIDGWLEERAKQ